MMRASAFVIVALVAAPVDAAILGIKQLSVDLRSKKDARKKISWSPRKHVGITAGGLGWNGNLSSLWEGWILTRPVAVGISWRPARSVNLRVTIKPAEKTMTLPDGSSYTTDPGQVFARYSPDRKHWSTWHPLQQLRTNKNNRKNKNNKKALSFEGQLGVPRRTSSRYDALLQAYQRRTDVPWSSDEEALVRSIVKRDPQFFSRQKPFIGYVQLLWEGTFHGGHRLTELEAHISFAVSGIHSPPKKKHLYKGRDGPWRFVGP